MNFDMKNDSMVERRKYNMFYKFEDGTVSTFAKYTAVAENKERLLFLLKEELDNNSYSIIDDFEIEESDEVVLLEERFINEELTCPWTNGSILIRWAT